MDNCRFCKILADYNDCNIKPSNSIPIYNTILCETANFIVIPALGSLVPGYVMVVARRHIYSMAYLLNNEIEELSNLLNYLREIIVNKFKIAPIIFEHGSAVGCFSQSANSVDHAHIHVTPVCIEEDAKIIQDANARKIFSIQELVSFKGKPYFLYIDKKGVCYISNNKKLASQYMRKWIAAEIGCPLEWDWKQYNFVENINTTVELLLMKGT